MIDKITRLIRWAWPYRTDIRKSISAGAAAVPIAMGLVQVDGIEWWEWVYVAAAALFAGMLTWVVPNDDAKPEPVEPPLTGPITGTHSTREPL